jgi:hypothetical protein
MIVGIIQALVEALPLGTSPETYPTFKLGEKEFQNFISDEIEGTIVYLDEPITSNDVITQGGYIEETYPITMLFATKSELDWTPEQHQEVILSMRALSKRFLNRLTTKSIAPNVRSVSAVSRTDIKNIFDVNLSGVIMRLTIVPFNSDGSCP